MKKSLFGKNIPVNCSYCEYNGIENDIMFCKKSKQVKDGKCRSFKYDPLLRMPNVTVFKTDFSAKDFKLIRRISYFYYTGMNFVNIPFRN